MKKNDVVVMSADRYPGLRTERSFRVLFTGTKPDTWFGEWVDGSGLDVVAASAIDWQETRKQLAMEGV
jgi:hypothetical protein